MQLQSVDLDFNYSDFGSSDKATGYERLLYDAMTGDRSLYKRADIVETGWAVVDPILTAWTHGECGLATYPAGSDGPAEADELLMRDGRRWKTL